MYGEGIICPARNCTNAYSSKNKQNKQKYTHTCENATTSNTSGADALCWKFLPSLNGLSILRIWDLRSLRDRPIAAYIVIKSHAYYSSSVFANIIASITTFIRGLQTIFYMHRNIYILNGLKAPTKLYTLTHGTFVSVCLFHKQNVCPGRADEMSG